MDDLDGRVALITGAANGQGAAEARLFADNRATVVVTDLDDANGQEVVRNITQKGGRALYLHHDVASEADWRKVLEGTQSEFGGLHVLVNNAGIVPRKTLDQTPLETWNKTLAVNLTGPMLGMKLAAPIMRDSGGGSIINVSSSAGMIAHYDASYTASKWGLRGLTKTAAVEYAPWGIRVNSIHPGIITGTALVGSATQDLVDSSSACIPMQRAGIPEECADLVMFLASPQSSFITGTEIPIDGGYVNGATMWMRRKLQSELANDS